MTHNGTDISNELDRLRQFRTPHERVELPGGEHLHVRQLSPADALLLSADDPESGLKTLALSLCTDDGRRIFGRSNLEKGVEIVGEWPNEYVLAVNPAIAHLNDYTNADADLSEVVRRD